MPNTHFKSQIYRILKFLILQHFCLPNDLPAVRPGVRGNLSTRKMCLGRHICLGNPVLPDRIYCPSQDQGSTCNSYVTRYITMQFCLIPAWSLTSCHISNNNIATVVDSPASARTDAYVI